MSTNAISPLRQRMIEDMNARKLGADTQQGHILNIWVTNAHVLAR